MPLVAATVFVPAAGRHQELLRLLGELQVSIHTEPGSTHYSVHQAVDQENSSVLVIQAFSSEEAFQTHSAAMAAADVPARLGRLLEHPPRPPVLHAQVPLGGDVAKARLGTG